MLITKKPAGGSVSSAYERSSFKRRQQRRKKLFTVYMCIKIKAINYIKLLVAHCHYQN